MVKIATGDLRVGLREGLVLDAIARAFDAEPAAVRRAMMASGDAGKVAVAARHGGLDELRVAYGMPIGFMLASPIFHAERYEELDGAEWLVEDKFDGIRAQAHVRGGSARLFSRRLNDVSAPYPEIVAALPQAVAGDAILDGEILAMRDGRVLPFRSLQARLQRKSVDDALLREVPSRSSLSTCSRPATIAPRRVAVAAPRAARIVAERGRTRAFGALRARRRCGYRRQRAFRGGARRGNEGLVLKRADSPYAPGRRGKWWRKLKRELATLDVAVVAVEWGHGKRAQVLSDYTFAVRDGDRLLAIGKAYSGLTDAEIAELTPWFLEHRLPAAQRRPKARGSEIPVEPKIVVEVAFDVVARSELHESGFALRFPRIVRIRDDKPPEEIDTLDRVREIHQRMLARESPVSS